MKVAVTAEGDTLDSPVADDFGHAPFILVVDCDTLDYRVVENEFVRELGAGMKVAEAIASLDVQAVITGGIGHHGIAILSKAGIRVSSDEDGTVEEAMADFRRRHELRMRFEGKSD
ncbi:MAG: hypothetical protein GX224_00110 [Thermoplasmatales archaeon]|nr:hypothetical protein [Thermoplasmatales archaeon]